MSSIRQSGRACRSKRSEPSPRGRICSSISRRWRSTCCRCSPVQILASPTCTTAGRSSSRCSAKIQRRASPQGMSSRIRGFWAKMCPSGHYLRRMSGSRHLSRRGTRSMALCFSGCLPTTSPPLRALKAWVRTRRRSSMRSKYVTATSVVSRSRSLCSCYSFVVALVVPGGLEVA